MRKLFHSLGFLDSVLLITASVVLLISLVVIAWVAFEYYLVEPSFIEATSPPVGMEDWQEIHNKGVIVVGVSGDYFPFAYYRDGQLEGFDVAMMSSIAHELGLEIEWRELARDGFGPALRLKQIDAAISSIGIDPELLTFADLTQAYFRGQDAVLLAVGAQTGHITHLGSLSLKRTGVIQNSLFQSIAMKSLVRPGVMSPQNLIVFANLDDAVQALQDGQIDALYMDALEAERISSEKGLAIAGKGLSDLDHRIAVRKGSEVFLNQIKLAYHRLLEKGRLVPLEQQYLIPAHISLNPFSSTPGLMATATPLPAAMPNCLDGMEIAREEQVVGDLIRVLPGQIFEQHLLLKNTGTCDWTGSYRVAFSYGNSPASRMGSQPISLEYEVKPGVSGEITLQLIAPLEEGFYQGFWNLVNPKNTAFGERIELKIIVDADLPPTVIDLLTSTGTALVESPPIEPTLQVAAPMIQVFTIAPADQIYLGECVLIEWFVEGVASRTRLTRNQVELLANAQSSGSYFDCPAVLGTVLYGLSSEGPGGYDQRQEDVNIFSQPPMGTPTPASVPTESVDPQLPVILLFEVSPHTVVQGECVIVEWKMGVNTSQVSLLRDGLIVLNQAPFSGIAQDCLQVAKTITYRLLATNDQGQSVERDVVVTVTVP
jgi:polar amino acid transport system substrate-binding protein